MPESDPSRPVPEPFAEVRKSFAEHVDETRDDVIKLASMTAESVRAATQSLLDADMAGVERVLSDDTHIDEFKEQIEFRIYELFALQQPMARDLRTLLAALRILQELQLTSDLTVSIAKAARRVYPRPLAPKMRGLIERMGDQAGVQLNVAIDAYADSDDARAAALPDMDDVMDELQRDLFRLIFATCTPDERGLQQAVQLALLGRYYERIADHAVLVGAWTRFVVTGTFPSRTEQTDASPEV